MSKPGNQIQMNSEAGVSKNPVESQISSHPPPRFIQSFPSEILSPLSFSISNSRPAKLLTSPSESKGCLPSSQVSSMTLADQVFLQQS